MGDQIIDAPLTWQAVAAVASGAKLALSPGAQERIAHARTLVDAIVEKRLLCYGVNTGVGALCDVVVDIEQQRELSRNIVMSHACAVGAPLPIAETRAVMTCAINNFAHGHCGVRPVVVEHLLALLNADLIPVVPRSGSLGYLTLAAHIALVLIAEGSVHLGDVIISGRVALENLELPPLLLEAKEGLSLVNGTADSTGLACLALQRLSRLLDWADIVAAMTFENVGHDSRALSAEALRYRVSDDIHQVARRLSSLVAGSQLLAHATPRTQDAMSLRAVPQVHGAMREAFEGASAVVDRELASVTDNPIVDGTADAPQVYMGAFAIASALAQTVDGLAIAAAKLGAVSERRIDRLVNPLLNGLPAFLARDPGVSNGFMIAQYTALALSVENRRLAAPTSLDGGVSCGLQEDEIPHVTSGALRLLQIIDNLQTILGIELLAAAQAYEFQDAARARAPMTDAVYRSVRECVAPYADDRPMASDIQAAVRFLAKPAPHV